MKIQYVGHSPKMSVTIPVGASKRFQNEVVHFQKGDIKELSDADGQKLLDLNKHNDNYLKVEESGDHQEDAVSLSELKPKNRKPKNRKPKKDE